MGWDAYATPYKELPENKKASFVDAAIAIAKDCGAVDGLLSEGGLDCGVCARVLEKATQESPWVNEWTPEKVKELAHKASWPSEDEDTPLWAIASARVFLNMCAAYDCGIEFSF